MPFALSTLGCPELTLSQATQLAGATGFAGLELRSAPDGTINRTANANQRHRWRQRLRKEGVGCVSVASYVKLCDATVDDETFMAGATAELHLAHSVGATWLRVFAGGPKGVPCPTDIESRAGLRLRRLADLAEDVGVTVAVETHDSHPTARDVMRLLKKAGRPNVAVIWDVLHTWLGRESPSTTRDALGSRLAYIQVKDVPSRDDLTPTLLGEGVLPLQQCVDLAREGNPDMWVAWEYERKWHPEVAPLTRVASLGHQWLTKATGQD